jgi:type II secretory pathway component PulF
VIPAIAEIFHDQQRQLPLPTVNRHRPEQFSGHVLVLIPVALLGGIFLYRRYSRTDEGGAGLTGLKLKIPLSGYSTEAHSVRFTQNWGFFSAIRVDIRNPSRSFRRL